MTVDNTGFDDTIITRNGLGKPFLSKLNDHENCSSSAIKPPVIFLLKL